MESLFSALRPMSASMEALAAIAAHLRVLDGAPADPAVAAQLAEVARLSGVPADLGPEERAIGASFARAFLRQALELIEHPERPSGWTGDDPVVVESQGRASAILAHIVAELPAQTPLRCALSRPGARLLDVGTGVGWLAIAMARAFPGLEVVGLDRSASVLERARANVAREGLEARVTLVAIDVAALSDVARYDAIWLPGPFLSAETLAAAAMRARSALVPSGILVVGLYGGAEPLVAAIANLRAIRSGGHAWALPELQAVLEGAGLVEVGEIPQTWPAPIRLVTACRPPR